MKKTLTVNLGGIVFNIDEDAYQLLDNYFANLRVHFRNEVGTDEIMDDFESRISELLNERLKMGFQVITIVHVEEVIKRMGKPEEIFEEEKTGKEQFTGESNTSKDTAGTKKRLMRDPDDRILGGVASGLAYYMGVDVTIVRLLLLISLFFAGPVIFALYLVLWLVVPLAKTAADKLVMRGESVNIENIGKAVTDNFDRLSGNFNEYIHSDKPRTALQKTGDFIVSFFGIILKFFAVLIGIVLIPALLLAAFVLIVVIFALLVGGLGTVLSGIPFIGGEIQMLTNIPDHIAIIGSIGGLLFIGIPLIGLFYLLFGNLLKLSPMSTGAKWVLIILWVISIVLCGITAHYTILEGVPVHF